MASGEKVCRTCFTVGENYNSINDSCENFLTSVEMLEYLLGVKLKYHSSDDFQAICHPCQKKLMTGYSFKYQSLAFEQKIQEIMAKRQPNVKKIIDHQYLPEEEKKLQKVEKEDPPEFEDQQIDDQEIEDQDVEYLETVFEEEKYQINAEVFVENDEMNFEGEQEIVDLATDDQAAQENPPDQREDEKPPVKKKRLRIVKPAKQPKREYKRKVPADTRMPRCLKCNLFFNGKHEHQLHYRKYHESTVLCTECGKNVLKRYYAAHMSSSHRGEKKFACDFCDKRYSQVGGLNNHRRIHTGEKPYVCVCCDMRFSQSWNLQEHLRKDHEILTGTAKTKTYTCLVCHKNFGRRYHLKKHEEIHMKNKTHKCQKCDIRFPSSSALHEHSKQHLVETDEDSVQSPEKRIDENLKIYPIDSDNTCSVCGESFASVIKLSAHMSVHTEKNFSCIVCGKSFISQLTLQSHMKHHSRAEVYKCPFCPTACVWSHHLRKHIVKYHPEQPVPSNDDILTMVQSKETVNLLKAQKDAEKDEKDLIYIEYIDESE
ncbi:hypothetical protein DMENIID0001_054840 [Sergentomyia squamirostris]